MRIDIRNHDDGKQVYNLTAFTIRFKICSQRQIQVYVLLKRNLSTIICILYTAEMYRHPLRAAESLNILSRLCFMVSIIELADTPAVIDVSFKAIILGHLRLYGSRSRQSREGGVPIYRQLIRCYYRR